MKKRVAPAAQSRGSAANSRCHISRWHKNQCFKVSTHTLQKLSRKGESFQGLLVCTRTECWDTEFVRSQRTEELLPRAAGPTSHPLHIISLPLENIVRTNSYGKVFSQVFFKKLAVSKGGALVARRNGRNSPLSFKAPEGGQALLAGETTSGVSPT